MHIQTSDQPELKLGFGGYTCNWGTHICGIYESEAERDEIIMGFLGYGVMEGDIALYCPSERNRGDFEAKFAEYLPGFARDQGFDDVEVFSARELYYPRGEFSPFLMDKGLKAFYSTKCVNGVRNVRAIAEMTWALESVPGIEHLMAYEARLNYFIPGKPWVSICLYNLKKFGIKAITDVLRTHPYTISQGMLIENPHYVPPEEWLSENAPEFLDKPSRDDSRM